MNTSGTFATVVAGATRSAPGAVARRLALPVDLVQSILDEAERMGLLSRYGGACSSCVGLSVKGCVGCPMTTLRREA